MRLSKNLVFLNLNYKYQCELMRYGLESILSPFLSLSLSPHLRMCVISLLHPLKT